MAIMIHAKFHFNWLMLTLIFGIWASEPPRAWRTTEKAGPDRVNGIVPSLMGSVYVYMYAVDSPKRQEEAMNTRSQSPSSFRLVSWFILRADRDTGPTA